MKWERLKANPPVKKSAPPPEEIKKEFAQYVKFINTPTIGGLRKKGFREWLICSSEKDKDIISTFTAADRFSYEAFVGGFLYYFEKYDSKKKKDNRTLLFDWGIINKKVPLTIFLNPLKKKYYDDNGNQMLIPPPPGPLTDPPQPPVPPPPPRNFAS